MFSRAYLLDLDRRVSLDILKTDISQYLHYMEYINCIPFEYQANWVGNTVLMRDWEIKDAEFCYLFVSQSIMQWERNCREPIQESCVSEEHQVEFVDEICEVSATAVFPSYGCQYLFENEEARLFYCDKTGFDRLKNCLKKNVVTITEKKLKGSCIQTHTLHYANVVHFDIQLVMNSPATWEVVLVYYAVPFTLKDMLDSSKNFFIDDCNRNELMKIGFDSEKADLFIRKRKEIGQIDSIEKACKLYNEVRDTLTKIKKNLTSSTLLGILEKDISR